MSKPQLVKRYTLFMIGIIANAVGVAITTKSSLGTTPISSVPYVLSLIFPLSFGTFTFFLNLLMVIGQLLLLKRDFPRIQYFQLAATVVFSGFIDLTMLLLQPVYFPHYYWQVLFLLLGCAILGLGICLEVFANVMYIPGEGLVRAITRKLSREFGTVKIGFDVSLVIGALLISWLCLNHVEGIREGTVVGALLVGLMARFFMKTLRPLKMWFYR